MDASQEQGIWRAVGECEGRIQSLEARRSSVAILYIWIGLMIGAAIALWPQSKAPIGAHQATCGATQL